MILPTNLKHVASASDLQQIIESSENVMVCCGRMGPMCIPVYKVMKELEQEYPQVDFRDMAFDMPDARVIRELPEARGFMGLPFTVYYKKGKVVAATSSIQSEAQVRAILDKHFTPAG